MCRERVKLWFDRCLHKIETYSNLYPNLTKAIIFILVVCFAIYLGIVTELAIAFAFLSIVIATFFASRSLKLTNESLKLTRSTVRPFLSIQTGGISTRIVLPTEVALPFEVKNTGAIPGEMLAIDIAFFGDDEIINNDNVSKKYPILFSETPAQPVIFPNATFVINHIIDISVSPGKQMLKDFRNGKVKIRHRIKYKDKNAEYLTVQTEQLEREKENSLKRSPIPPQFWT